MSVSTSPSDAARSAVSRSPDPRKKATAALTPMPRPTLTAMVVFCSGKISDRAVIAFSLIWEMKKLSTML